LFSRKVRKCGFEEGRGASTVKQQIAVTRSDRIMLRNHWLAGCAAGVLMTALCGPIQAQTLPRTQYGNVGLIEMPSARMAPDAELSVSAAFFENGQRYALNFQALPWLETSFRYSGLEDFDPGFTVFFDRAFGVKARLWEEGGLMPSLAIGTNDLVGTGVYSSEYVVASKHLGSVDLTLGMGWGRLATANTIRNPLTNVSSSFNQRDRVIGQGGNFDFGRYFHGRQVGIFGGATWQTPVSGLMLLAEYSSDKYLEETRTGVFKPKSQINIGVAYAPFNGMTLGAGWFYGRSVYGNITLNLDPTSDDFPQRIGPTLPPISIRSEDEQSTALRRMRLARTGQAPVNEMLVDVLWNRNLRDVSIQGQVLHLLQVPQASASLCATLAREIAPYSGDIRTLMLNDNTQCVLPSAFTPQLSAVSVPLEPPLIMAQSTTIDATGPSRPSRAQADTLIRGKAREQNINVLAFALRETEAILYYENNNYQQESEAIDRLHRILMAYAPTSVEVFRLISVVGGMPHAEINIARGTLERAYSQQGTFNLFRDQGRYLPAPENNPVLTAGERGTYPRLNWNMFPQFRQQLFDPVNPLGVQFVMVGEVSAELLPNLRFVVQGEANLFNDFNVNRPTDSVLPHVRTDFVRYFSQGQNGIGLMQFESNFRLSRNTFASVRAGYLESMFAGVGGEVLWQPEGQRWSLGLDIYYVKQREFDRLLGLQSYSQSTGHMTFYYASPWYNLDFQFRIGRYLAGDWGSTVQITRRFASGIEVGVFATKTNVSSAQFGEGSFDKGIIIRLPLSHIMPVHTQQTLAMDLRSIQRDGGQVLQGDALLYEKLRRTSEAEIRRTSLD
jgi:hypothetical protein